MQNWTGTWVNNLLQLGTYDNNSNLTEYVSKTWSNANSTWNNSSRDVLTYDGFNNRISDTNQTWVNSSWFNTGLTMYNYDVNNNLISAIWQNWMTSWVNLNKSLLVYDANDNNVSMLQQYWSGNSWENASQWLYTYNVNANPLAYIQQNWDSTSISWITVRTTTDDYCGNCFNGRASYFLPGPVLFKTDSSTNFCNFKATSIRSSFLNESQCLIYPNPVADFFEFEVPAGINVNEIRITDVLGHTVKHFSNPLPSSYINVSDLNSGVYFATISCRNGCISKKIIVTR
jgi:hypothetical protein